jgi:3-deoxy-D-arabino-heptulosonate 7-phosphate (DAHP) synthase
MWQELVVVMNVNFETSASAAGWKGLVRPSLPHGVWHTACGVRRVWRGA